MKHKHKYNKWEYIGEEDFDLTSLTILERKCKKCDKVDRYIGLVNICVETGKRKPYIYTN